MIRSGSRLALIVAFFLAIALTGCVHLFPVPKRGQSEEAKTLGRIMKTLASETLELLDQERQVANGLKITLDESASTPGPEFRRKLSSFADQLIEIRNRRRHVLETLRERSWSAPIVSVIHQKTEQVLEDEVKRIGTWIQLAQNVRLRADLGRDKEFPELAMLSGQLQGFLSLATEDSLSRQLAALRDEFGFSDGDLN